jgi:4-hydroxybenzoate polyprenyltransferase
MLSKILRTKFWLKSLIPVVLCNLYIWLFLFNVKLDIYVLFFLILFLLSSIGFASLGYFINDFFDKKSDFISGKKNIIGSISPFKQKLFFVISLFVAIFPWLFLHANQTLIILLAFQFSLFLLYSAPPFRLKEIPFLSNLTDAAYAYCIPLLITYFAVRLNLNSGESYFFVLLFLSILYIVVGFKNLLIHQLKDVQYDKLTDVVSTFIFLGEKKVNFVLIILLLMEFFLIIVAFFMMESYPLKLIIYTITLLIFANGFYEYFNHRNFTEKNIKLGEFSNSLYQFFIPMSVLVLMILFIDFWWLLILFAHLIFFSDFDSLKRKITPNSLLKDFWHKGIKSLFYNVIKPFVGFILNYILFFLFKLFGVNLKREKKSALEYIKEKFF